MNRWGPSTEGVIVPVHRADQTVLVSASGAWGMSTTGSTTVSAGSPSGVSPFQYSPSRPVPSRPAGASTSAGTTGSARVAEGALGERHAHAGPAPAR